METLKFIEQKHLIRKKDIIKEILLSIFLGISTFLCFQEMFQFTLNFSEEYRGGIRSGFIYTWNQIVDVLGNENYILLPKFSGAGEGNTIFLIILLFLFSIIYFLFIHSRNRWAMYAFLLFVSVFSEIANLQISMEKILFFAITVVAAVLYVRNPNGVCNKLCLFIFMIIVCATIFSSPIGKKINARSETICKIQSVLKTKVKENYYGSNLLKNGDLSQRKREKSEKEAFKITMQNPQSIYLRGFVGESYKDNHWETLPKYNYYKEHDFFYWLEKENFHALGQLGQAKTLVNKEKMKKENEITIQVKEADSRYAYIPYEMISKISDGKTWGGSFVSTSSFNRLTNYKYSMGDNAVKTWTDTAAKMFLLAETETVKDYLRSESNYNAYVYQNFTYLSKKEKSILNTYIGKAGDQSKGHIDYKPAIQGVQKYLEDNFIYTENLGKKTEDGKSMLEEFLASKKGYDVQFATAATLIFRYYGIPARYVEGYLITPKDAKKMESGKATTISKSNAHAWVEIYIDGTGFIPIEVSPPYRKIMEEADMEIGISNNSLVRSFDNKGAVNKQTEETESAGDHKKHVTFSILAIIIMLIILFLLVVCLKLLWKYFICFKEYRKRRKLFYKAIPKQAVSAIYSYMEDKEYPIEDKVRKLGNKAAYSKEELSEEERKEMLIALKSTAKEKKKNDKKSKKHTY
ncbi:transglutaminase-like domain-containing protein [Faecalimonas sp.]